MAITKAQRQEVRSLKRKDERWKTRKIMVEGEKCIEELRGSSWIVERIYFTSSWSGHSILDAAIESGIEIVDVSQKDMEMMSALKTCPGLLALAHFPSNDVKQCAVPALYLDGLTDPGNVGTLVRTADWFGWEGVIVSRNSADPFGPKALQASMGSAFHIPIHVLDFGELEPEMRRHVVGLDAGGVDMYATPKSTRPTLLVVGSESHGLSDEVKTNCDFIASIPGAGRTESLNAASSGAIAMAHFFQMGGSVDQRS